MATIKDIARMSGYSIGTVSRVINNRADVSDKARKKIEEVISEHQYEPNSSARMLKQTMSSEVSVIVRGTRSIFFESVLEGVQIRMKEYGESINVHFIREMDDEVAAAVQIVQQVKPKGLIFLGGSSENIRKEFSQITVPSVLLTIGAGDLGFDNLSSFTTDDEEASGFAVGKLLELGHTRIGILGGYLGDGRRFLDDYSALRVRGAVKELAKHGIVFDMEKDHEECAFSAESGYQAAGKLLKKSPDLTGIFGVNDAMAMGAIRAFIDMGLNVPEDISVIGFNGVDYIKYSHPRLATIRQDVSQLAAQGVEDLLRRVSYGIPAIHEKIPYEFVNGESLAPPRKE